jgi:hypothetical protein
LVERLSQKDDNWESSKRKVAKLFPAIVGVMANTAVVLAGMAISNGTGFDAPQRISVALGIVASGGVSYMIKKNDACMNAATKVWMLVESIGSGVKLKTEPRFDPQRFSAAMGNQPASAGDSMSEPIVIE